MNTRLSSLADFDSALADKYASYRSQCADQPESIAQRRFSQYCVFPKLGWTLIEIGEAQALSSKDPSVLYGTVQRFLKCAHHCWGNPDEQGLHFGGYDFCSLVVPSLYSALLGKTYLTSVFHCARPMSKTGYGAYLHAANLLVSLECSAWPFREKSIARAGAFVSSTSKSEADRAFVRFFNGIVDRDRPAIREALNTFSNSYLRSDWGRHKPLTRATFIQSLITYASSHLADAIDAQTHRNLISIDRIELWSEVSRCLDELHRSPHRFPEPIGFLNEHLPQ